MIDITPTLSGDETAPVKRFTTGFYSFDRALANDAGEIGMPLGTGYEIYGQKGVGKTTFIYSMLGFLGAKFNKDVTLASVEDYDSDNYLRILKAQGFSGDSIVRSSGSDEEILTNWMDDIRPIGKNPPEPRQIAALDSIGAVSSASEQDGDLGMGYNTGRAILMAQVSRRVLPVMSGRKPGSEYIILYTNHWYPNPGGMGWASPGGNAKEYLCRVRILLKRKDKYNDGHIIEGEVHKNNYGYERRKFYMFIRYGHGIHFGLTAMWDAILEGKATKGTVVKIKDKSFGYINDIVSNKYDDPEFFQPFVDVLND